MVSSPVGWCHWAMALQAAMMVRRASSGWGTVEDSAGDAVVDDVRPDLRCYVGAIPEMCCVLRFEVARLANGDVAIDAAIDAVLDGDAYKRGQPCDRVVTVEVSG